VLEQTSQTVMSGAAQFTYLNRCLHYHIGGIVDALGAQLQNGCVTFFLCLADVVVDFLWQIFETLNTLATTARPNRHSPAHVVSTWDAQICDTTWRSPWWPATTARVQPTP
jgi:hypothetical protein